MKILTSLNNFLDRFSFLVKTRLLFAILVCGMISVCFFTFISLFALKYDHEMLFQNRVLPIEKLENIRNLYLTDSFLIIQSYHNKQTDLQNSQKRLSALEKKIDSEWENYQKSTDQQISSLYGFAHWWLNLFVRYDKDSLPISSQLAINKSIDENTKTFRSEIKRSLDDNFDQDAIFSHLYKLAHLYSSLIDIHIQEANSDKVRTDKGFLQSIIALNALIIIVFIVSCLASLFVIRHIRILHNYLEFDVKTKTKELEDLNSSLEERIKKEVAISREKDNILFQQSKLASLGEMLQNIAHQWRQPLGAISMIIQSFDIKNKSGKLTSEFITSRVEDAQLLAKNMSETLDDFRTFFNPNKSKKEFSLKEVINKSIDLSRYLIDKEDIDLHLCRFKDVKFYGFKNELTHVLLNLINNAKDALKSRENQKKVRIMVEFNEKHIIIRVIDNAGGVKPDILPKIFDPYFTTKHQSVGTGIGLYMSKQIIEEHMNGNIYCENIEHKLGGSYTYQCAMFVVEIPIYDVKEVKEDE